MTGERPKRAGSDVERPHFLWWKLGAVWAGFLALHFSYDAIPGTAFRILAEEHETTFLHMKMLFVAYVVVSLIELAARRARLPSVATFVYSRALVAVAFPWFTITLWFTSEALGFGRPGRVGEIVYANIATFLGIYAALRMEELFEGVHFRPAMKAMVVLLFVVAVLSYVAFSLDTPMPFFTTPPEYL